LHQTYVTSYNLHKEKFILEYQMSQLECGTCKFAFMEKDRHGEVQIECRRHPPILFNSGSLAKFPKILPNWSCGDYSLGDQNYWDLENS